MALSSQPAVPGFPPLLVLVSLSSPDSGTFHCLDTSAPQSSDNVSGTLFTRHDVSLCFLRSGAALVSHTIQTILRLGLLPPIMNKGWEGLLTLSKNLATPPYTNLPDSHVSGGARVHGRQRDEERVGSIYAVVRRLSPMQCGTAG